MTADLWLLGKVYLLSLIWQAIGWPWVSLYFKKLADKGWALARVMTTLVIAIGIWFLAYWRVPVNTTQGVGVGVIILSILSLVGYWKRGRLKREEIREILVMIMMEEYLFLVGLLLMGLTRGFAPEIHTLEKFMDFGFINSYLNSPTLPARDMWYATQNINYYAFGHFWASILIRLMGVTAGVGYNLVLALIAGWGLMLTFSLVASVVGNRSGRVMGGLLGAVAVCVGGNSHALWYFVTHTFSMNGYWYANATRFIYNTIHEFPSYSFVVSDLHGHLLDLPVVLSFLIIFYHWTVETGLWEEIAMGVGLGIMTMTNTWDLPIYGLLLGVYGLWSLVTNKLSMEKILRAVMVIGFSGVVVALPWWREFSSIASGVGIVSLRSPLWQLGVLWSGGLISLAIASYMSRKNKNRVWVFSLGVTTVLLLLIPELIYAKDIYPNHPRANTMFKLTYQAFIFMGISLGIAVGEIKNIKRGLRRVIFSLILLCVLGGGLLFTTEAFPNYYNNFKVYKGLDGETWLTEAMPERKAVIDYLRTHMDGQNMVEAVGDSYTDFDVISVFSGVPTVLGWRVHEWLWRGGWEMVGRREMEIKDFYEDMNMEKTKMFIKKYQVGWVVVGDQEIQSYEINEEKLESLGKVVFREGKTYLIKITE